MKMYEDKIENINRDNLRIAQQINQLQSLLMENQGRIKQLQELSKEEEKNNGQT